MGKLNLAKGQPTRRLAVEGNILAGETSGQFQPSEPFKFLPASAQ